MANAHESTKAPTRSPFGIPEHLIEEAWQASSDRERGVRRYVQFATELESAVGAYALHTGVIQALALAREHARLMRYAKMMALSLERALNTVDHLTDGRADTGDDHNTLQAYRADYGTLT